MLGRIGEGGGHRVTGDRHHRARHIGWDRVHVAIDDHSRLAYAEELPDEAPVTTAASCGGPGASTLPTASRSSGS
jgi:hypothetical protein